MIDVPLAMPGSKRRVIERLAPFIPRPSSGRMIVPFFGTGADSLFFVRSGLSVLASDANPDLVRLANEMEDAFERTRDFGPIDRESYRAVRSEFNRTRDPALFLILVRTSFNSLVRYNRAREFNVPGPKKTGSWAPLESVVSEFADMVEKIGGVDSLDFEDALARARPGDVAYLDPPYLGTFDNYTGRGFDHDRLFDLLAWLPIPWAMSNAPEAADYFPGARVFELERAGTVSSKGSARSSVKEVLIVCEG